MKSKQFLLGVFGHEDHIIGATRAARAAGYTVHDVYTPYAVHGLDQAMGLKPSRLTWVCMAFACAGLSFGAFLQFWVGSIDWPLNVGGKPFNSLPAYLPVMFELTVLIGGLGVLLTLFFRSRLYPGKVATVPYPGVTNDRFVVALEEQDASFDPDAVTRLWQPYSPLEIVKHVEVAP